MNDVHDDLSDDNQPEKFLTTGNSTQNQDFNGPGKVLYLNLTENSPKDNIVYMEPRPIRHKDRMSDLFKTLFKRKK
ncbi:MAG: hypothetical protein OEV66_12860 [Spirochaetia bacterium]|nr:hypothetical protein [Spirochaetia bacterium]